MGNACSSSRRLPRSGTSSPQRQSCSSASAPNRQPGSSSSKPMNFKGTYTFQIKEFSFTKGVGVGNYISSDTFTLGDNSWEIQFFPDGKEIVEDGDNYVSIYLKLVSKCEKKLRVWYDISLGNGFSNSKYRRSNDGAGLVWMNWATQRLVGPHTVNADNPTIGYDQFCKRSDIYASNIVRNDNFTILCSIVVGNVETKTNIVNEMPAQPLVPLPLSNPKQSYGQLLESGEGSDIAFEVEGEIFNAHKIILSSRSPVFKAQFLGPLKDDNVQSIKVEEMQAPVFKALLHFIYYDVIPELDSDCVETIMIQHLLVAADRYGIETLKSLCESRLCEIIDIDTVASTLALSEQHGCSQLKSRCIAFIGLPENLEAVMETDGFKNLNESCPVAMCELLKSVARGKKSLV